MLFDYLYNILHVVWLFTCKCIVTVFLLTTSVCAFANQRLDMNEKRKIWMNVMFMEASCI